MKYSSSSGRRGGSKAFPGAVLDNFLVAGTKTSSKGSSRGTKMVICSAEGEALKTDSRLVWFEKGEGLKLFMEFRLGAIYV